MKKIIIITLLCLFVAAGMFAASTKAYTQKVTDLSGNQFPDVTNGSSATAPGYVVRAWITTRPAEVTATTTHVASLIRLYRFGNGTTMPYDTRVFLQMSTFTTQWAMGDIVHVEVTNNNVAPAKTDFWEIPIPDGTGSAWTVTVPQALDLWPVASNTLAVTSNYLSEIFLDGVTTGHFTPYTFNPATAGTYTVQRAYTTFNPVNYVYDGTGEESVNFVGTATPLAPINPTPANMAVIDRANGAAPAPVNLSWEWNPAQVTAPDSYNIYWPADAAAPINQVASSWVTPAIGFGAYNWKVEAVWTDPAKSSAVPLKVKMNGRDAGTKGTGAAATWTFTINELPPPTVTYTLNVNGPDGYAVTGPVNGTTDYVATDNDDMVNELVGDYTIAVAPAGFHWAVNPITVAAGDFDPVTHIATIEFMLVENVIDPLDPPAGVVVTPGGDNGMPGTDGGLPATIYTIAASGVWDVVVNKPAGFGYPWYAFINATPMLASGPILVDTYTFVNVDFGAKAPLVVTLDDDEALTLPVELSYFAATLTAQNFVKLTWVSQSETGLLGYRVYRSESNDQANAISITPSMIPATNTSTTQTYSILDEEVAIGSTYYYWLESVDMGHSTFFGPTSVLVQGEVPPVLPEYTTMRNAYPNPFRANTGTTIEVNVKAGETGQVTIYNVLGQVVKTYSVKEGINPINWNGRDSKGNVCGSGIYFYKLSTPSMNMTKKMVVVK